MMMGITCKQYNLNEIKKYHIIIKSKKLLNINKKKNNEIQKKMKKTLFYNTNTNKI